MALQSILDHARPERRYDILILGLGLSSRQADAVRAQAAGHSNVSVRCIDIAADFRDAGLDRWNTFPPYNGASFVQLLIPRVCRAYDKALALHGDIVALDDVATLFDTPLGDHLLAAARHRAMKLLLADNPVLRRHYASLMSPEYLRDGYFNPGVILFNVARLQTEGLVDAWFRDGPHPRNLLLEEEVLNVSCQGRVAYLSDYWHVMWSWLYLAPDVPPLPEAERNDLDRHARLIHYDGPVERQRRLWREDCALPFWACARRTPFYEKLLRSVCCGEFVTRLEAERALGVGHRIKRYLTAAVTTPCRFAQKLVGRRPRPRPPEFPP